jgi:hypothetical protein
MRPVLTWLFAVPLLLGGCAGTGSNGRQVQDAPAAPYVRIASSDSNHIELQIAAREFLPARKRDPVVWLTGVSHIGDTNYYAALQSLLDMQTLVLFEGVGSAQTQEEAQSSETAMPAPRSRGAEQETQENHGSLQSAIASSLGLVFQLEAIDYRHPNFRNSDLSITQLRQLMAEQESASGTSGAGQSFDDLLGFMAGNSWFDSLLQIALRFLGANPKLQALGRLALIDLLGQLQGDPSRVQGLPLELRQVLEVLLQRRNEKVISDLKTQIPTIGSNRSIAIFFGTGHMPDLETHLRQELKYRAGRDIWFTAFGVDLARAKVSANERSFVENFVKWQLEETVRHTNSTVPITR